MSELLTRLQQLRMRLVTARDADYNSTPDHVRGIKSGLNVAVQAVDYEIRLAEAAEARAIHSAGTNAFFAGLVRQKFNDNKG
jgi:hypothetical protein